MPRLARLKAMLPLFGLLSLLADQAAYAYASIPLPEVGRSGIGDEWRIYTAQTDPKEVESALEVSFKGRPGWTEARHAWNYRLPGPFDPKRYLAVSVGVLPGRAMRRSGDTPRCSRCRGVEVSVGVLPGRAMRRGEAVPQRGLWTTVLVSVSRSMIGGGPIPHEEWVSAPRPQDDAASNVPVGEERNLAKLVGLRLVAHRTRFGVPWWAFTGPGTKDQVEARVGRALAGRPGWIVMPSSGYRGGKPFVDRNWSYGPPPGAEGRPLTLWFQSGRALSHEPAKPSKEPWATVWVVAGARALTSGPVGMWAAYP